jgi:predicted nucleotidyltransferase
MLELHPMGLPLAPLLDRLRDLQPELADKFGVTKVAAFGSYARNEAGPKSDLDLLLDFDRTPGLFELARLDQTLEEVLGVKVDTVPRDSLNPRYAPFILAELVPV